MREGENGPKRVPNALRNSLGTKVKAVLTHVRRLPNADPAVAVSARVAAHVLSLLAVAVTHRIVIPRPSRKPLVVGAIVCVHNVPGDVPPRNRV